MTPPIYKIKMSKRVGQFSPRRFDSNGCFICWYHEFRWSKSSQFWYVLIYLSKKIYIFYRMTNETTYETLTTELRGAMQEFFGYLSVRFSFILNWCYPNFIFLFLIVIIIRLDQKYLSKQFRDKWITTIQTYQY